MIDWIITGAYVTMILVAIWFGFCGPDEEGEYPEGEE